jgi:hypothetical protein
LSDSLAIDDDSHLHGGSSISHWERLCEADKSG